MYIFRDWKTKFEMLQDKFDNAVTEKIRLMPKNEVIKAQEEIESLRLDQYFSNFFGSRYPVGVKKLAASLRNP
jgi:hypothetical protein